MGERMSIWVALGTVAVAGAVTGVVMHAVGVTMAADSLRASGHALLSTARPEDAGPALAEYVLLAAVVEAVLVKLVVGALTGFAISLPRALAAGRIVGAAGLAPVVAVLARPAHSSSALNGVDTGYRMLVVPLSLAILAVHALLVAGLSEPRGSHGAFVAYTRAARRG
jgi:hypothetical protein